MYMTNEEWEQNNQDYLKESYEETGFTAVGHAVHKLICGGCGEKFTPKRADARYCSNSCRQKVYRKRVTDAASTQNEHIVFRTVSRSVENQVPPPGT